MRSKRFAGLEDAPRPWIGSCGAFDMAAPDGYLNTELLSIRHREKSSHLPAIFPGPLPRSPSRPSEQEQQLDHRTVVKDVAIVVALPHPVGQVKVDLIDCLRHVHQPEHTIACSEADRLAQPPVDIGPGLVEVAEDGVTE